MSDSEHLDQAQLEQSKLIMQARVAAHMNALPIGFKEEASKKAIQITQMNASPRVKLNKLYALVDAYTEMRRPFVACGEGCDSCCHMNVNITNLEAQRIEKITGKKAKVLRNNEFHPITKFAGIPCPFLVNHRCGIYEDRPLACRSHASFDMNDYWCDPECMNLAELPMVEITDTKKAIVDISLKSGDVRFADIRDFFN